MAICEHLEQRSNPAPRTPEGCEECLKTDGWWVHLRLCETCGHVGCCDASPGKHATKHFHATGHPVVDPYGEGEVAWRWCYVDEELEELDV